MKPITIYALCHPVTNEIRYIGKTTTPQKRYKEHCRSGGNTYCNKWVRSLNPHKPVMVGLEIAVEDWVEAEQFWIIYMKSLGARLTNLTVGGEGALGYVATEETRKKISNTTTGRTLTLEHRNKISINNKSKTGYKLSDEAKAKISLASMGNKSSAGRITPPEVRAKLSLTSRNMSLEARAKISAAGKGKILSSEHRAKISESGKLAQARRKNKMLTLVC